MGTMQRLAPSSCRIPGKQSHLPVLTLSVRYWLLMMYFGRNGMPAGSQATPHVLGGQWLLTDVFGGRSTCVETAGEVVATVGEKSPARPQSVLVLLKVNLLAPLRSCTRLQLSKVFQHADPNTDLVDSHLCQQVIVEERQVLALNLVSFEYIGERRVAVISEP